MGCIDDEILAADTIEEWYRAVADTVSLCDSLGLTISGKKFVIDKPVQGIEHLGFILYSVNMTVTLTQGKKDKIRHLTQSLLRKSEVTSTEFAVFLAMSLLLT